MKSVIEFASQEEREEARRLFPITKPRTKPAYEDLVLKPEYQPRKYSFPPGQSCIRILPQLAGSGGWMHVIHVLIHPNGQHIHPKSLKPKAKSVFDTAYGWLRANKPSALYSKENRDGYRLLSSPMALCWILIEIDGKMRAKLFLGSAFDGGKAGGNCGTAHQLFQVASEVNQPGGQDAAHAEHGVQIIVEKSTSHGSKYPSYKMTRNGMEAPISRYLERLNDSEIAAICPLGEVLRRVEPQGEWQLLANVVGEELRDEIRNSTAKPQIQLSPKPQPEPSTQVTDEASPLGANEVPQAGEEPSVSSDDSWRW